MAVKIESKITGYSVLSNEDKAREPAAAPAATAAAPAPVA